MNDITIEQAKHYWITSGRRLAQAQSKLTRQDCMEETWTDGPTLKLKRHLVTFTHNGKGLVATIKRTDHVH